MNAVMIRHLVAKDVAFHRLASMFASVAGVGALGLMMLPSKGMFYIGCVLLVTAMVSIGIYLAYAAVIHERTEGTLAFVMSLPITVRDYTLAKLLAAFALFLVPWLIMSAGTLWLITSREALPDGLTPFAVVILLYLLAGFVLILGTALVTESGGWTIGTMGTVNFAFNGFLYWTSNLPDIAATISGPTPVWTSSIRLLIAAELLVIAVALLATWLRQSRRTDST